MRDKFAVKELFGAVSQKIAKRPGGYTRIVRLGQRVGDGAEMCLIELVDFNENYSQAKGAAKKTTRRTRRAGGTNKTTKDAVVASEVVANEENHKVSE